MWLLQQTYKLAILIWGVTCYVVFLTDRWDTGIILQTPPTITQFFLPLILFSN